MTESKVEIPPVTFQIKENAMDALLESWRSMTTNNSMILRESVGSTGGPIAGGERAGMKIG